MGFPSVTAVLADDSYAKRSVQPSGVGGMHVVQARPIEETSPPRRMQNGRSARIARDLGLSITAGALPPGALLDREIDACSARKISRTAYREAILTLRAKGLVESRPRTGTRVRPLEDWHLFDPDVVSWLVAAASDNHIAPAINELCLILEPGSAALAAKRRSQGQLAAIRRALDAITLNSWKTANGRNALRAFHIAVVHASDNVFLISMTDILTVALDSLIGLRSRSLSAWAQSAHHHAKLFEAISSKNAEGARTAAVELFQHLAAAR